MDSIVNISNLSNSTTPKEFSDLLNQSALCLEQKAADIRNFAKTLTIKTEPDVSLFSQKSFLNVYEIAAEEIKDNICAVRSIYVAAKSPESALLILKEAGFNVYLEKGCHEPKIDITENYSGKDWLYFRNEKGLILHTTLPYTAGIEAQTQETIFEDDIQFEKNVAYDISITTNGTVGCDLDGVETVIVAASSEEEAKRIIKDAGFQLYVDIDCTEGMIDTIDNPTEGMFLYYYNEKRELRTTTNLSVAGL
jgi:hypothetical protein